MGKRSDFERRERDFYPTPYAAVVPLLPFITDLRWKGDKIRYWEPCAGNGILVEHLKNHGHLYCVKASDIEPQVDWVDNNDALTTLVGNIDFIITNPPWERKLKGENGKKLPSDKQPLHMMIEHFRKQAPTWLLFDADWWHTKQAIPFKPYCEIVVSVGRVKWIEGSKSTGKDNCAWYKFVPYSVNYTKLF